MKLVLAIAAAWVALDFFADKIVTRVFGTVDLSLWHQIAHAVAGR